MAGLLLNVILYDIIDYVMMKTIQNSFILLRDNIILVQPLIIYMLIIGFLIKPSILITFPSFPSILLIVCIFLLTTAFISGWFYINKVAIEHKNDTYETPEERSIASFTLLKYFFTGVGDYFLPVTFTFVLYLVVLALFSFVSYKIGVHFIGKPELDAETLKHISTGSYTDIYGYFTSKNMTDKHLLNIYNWSLYFSFLSLLFSILTIFIYPVIFYKTKNPIVALFSNLKFVFLNFFDATIIVFFLTLLNIVLSSINVFANVNLVFSVISLVLTLFYMNYYILLVFLYYEEKTQSNSVSGA